MLILPEKIFERDFFSIFKPIVVSFPSFPFLETWPTLEEFNHVFDLFQTHKAHSFICQMPMGKRTKRKWMKELQVGGHSAVSWFVANIVEQKKIPLRLENLHDFFNALSWIGFYQSKMALYDLYFKVWKENKVALGTRPRINDWLTTFDEGGTIAVCEEAEKVAILSIVQSQDLEAKLNLIAEKKITLIIFGHGLYECLTGDLQTINTACLVLGVKNYSSITLRDIDSLLAELLKEDPRPFAGSLPLARRV